MMMMKHLVIAAALTSSSVAVAGGQSGSIGVGVERMLNNDAGGLSVNYDAGQFHAGGFFSFHDEPNDNNHRWALGGRFFYHAHTTAMADFGLGLGIGFANVPAPTMMDPGNRATLMYVEPSAQIRLFLASNVALSFTAGLVIGTLDADGIDFDGQSIGAGAGLAPTALAGIHYYFFSGL